MKIKPAAYLFALVILITGCYSTASGGKKFGLPRKDSFESLYQRPVEELYDAAVRVLDHNGNIFHQDRLTNTLSARVNTTTVHVHVTASEDQPGVSRIKVQCRRSMNRADQDLCAELDKQIALQLVR